MTLQEYAQLPEKSLINIFVETGYSLISNVLEGKESQDKLRVLISIFTIPVDLLSSQFIENEHPWQQIKPILSKLIEAEDIFSNFNNKITELENDDPLFLNMVSRVALIIKTNPLIHWFDHEDPLYAASYLSGDDELDHDQNSAVSRYNNQLYVRLTIPSPSIYWQNYDIRKLATCSLVLLEELQHISQRDEREINLNSLGLHLDIMSLPPRVYESIRDLLSLLQENDVTTKASIFIGKDINNLQWYQERKSSGINDDHRIIRFDFLWLSALSIVQLTNNEENYVKFLQKSFDLLPYIFKHDPEKIEEFFSNPLVISSISSLIEALIVDDQTQDGIEFKNTVFGQESLIDYFLKYALMRWNETSNDLLDNLYDYNSLQNINPKIDITTLKQKNSQILENLITFFINNRIFLVKFLNKYKGINLNDTLNINNSDQFMKLLSTQLYSNN